MNASDGAEHVVHLQRTIAGLESFNRSVSHDLRGPLAGIVSLVRLAEAALVRDDGATARRMLALIGHQAQACTRLVSALLELASVDEAELRLAPVDLRALVHEVVEQLALAEPERGLPSIGVAELPAALVDAELLRPALLNLIGNAVKFTRDRPAPRIDVGACAGIGEVTVFVRDNGVGFEPGAARQLFEPFVRLHGQAFDGHGIGLSIVRRAVERHGGRAWATAAPDQGACFGFTLPQPR